MTYRRISASAPAISTPDDHDVESRYALGVRSGRHGQLEIAQDPVADVQRVGDVRHGQRFPLDRVDTEKVRHAARGQDQIVVFDLSGGSPQYFAGRIDAFDVGHPEIEILPAVEYLAERKGDIPHIELRAGHLVKQRLEHVVIVLVDQYDLTAGAAQGPDDRETCESAAYDDDAFFACVRNIECHDRCHSVCISSVSCKKSAGRSARRTSPRSAARRSMKANASS